MAGTKGAGADRFEGLVRARAPPPRLAHALRNAAAAAGEAQLFRRGSDGFSDPYAPKGFALPCV
jgi:hypothetical protein